MKKLHYKAMQLAWNLANKDFKLGRLREGSPDPQKNMYTKACLLSPTTGNEISTIDFFVNNGKSSYHIGMTVHVTSKNELVWNKLIQRGFNQHDTKKNFTFGVEIITPPDLKPSGYMQIRSVDLKDHPEYSVHAIPDENERANALGILLYRDWICQIAPVLDILVD